MHSPVKSTAVQPFAAISLPPTLGKAPPANKTGKYNVYVVFSGFQIGFVYDADLARSFTEHYDGAQSKGYKTLQAAHQAWNEHFAREPKIPTILHYHAADMGPSSHPPEWVTNGTATAPLAYVIAKNPRAGIVEGTTDANTNTNANANATTDVKADVVKDNDASTAPPPPPPSPTLEGPVGPVNDPADAVRPQYAVIRGAHPGVYTKYWKAIQALGADPDAVVHVLRNEEVANRFWLSEFKQGNVYVNEY
ncbi:hypothetical protein BD410DRAFT_839040 [Rickenella mellea]|uniref:Uncharacterized protein n=1 Tax=Rickenella mellea TaxID=50990 RepID=A0A4Y7Q718_9AGAM|nr:hypothetical protein BD410DRAFT_839040 [Rickenella mellea]